MNKHTLEVRLQGFSLVAVAALLLAGCAVSGGGEPIRWPSPQDSVGWTSHDGVRVGARPLLDPSQQQRFFDADLASSGVLAFQVLIHNKGDRPLAIRYSDVTLTLADGVRIEPAHAASVVLRLEGKPIGRPGEQDVPTYTDPGPIGTPYSTGARATNLAQGLVYLGGTLPGAFAAESSRHRFVDYERKMLPDTTVHPLRSVDGVVYFILDDVRKHVRPASLSIQFRDHDGKRDFVLEPAIP